MTATYPGASVILVAVANDIEMYVADVIDGTPCVFEMFAYVSRRFLFHFEVSQFTGFLPLDLYCKSPVKH